MLLDEDASILPIESLMQPCSLPGRDDAIRLELAFHGADPHLASNQLPRLVEAETTVLDAVVDAVGLPMLALIYPRCSRECGRRSEHQRIPASMYFLIGRLSYALTPRSRRERNAVRRRGQRFGAILDLGALFPAKRQQWNAPQVSSPSRRER